MDVISRFWTDQVTHTLSIFLARSLFRPPSLGPSHTHLRTLSRAGAAHDDDESASAEHHKPRVTEVSEHHKPRVTEVSPQRPQRPVFVASSVQALALGKHQGIAAREWSGSADSNHALRFFQAAVAPLEGVFPRRIAERPRRDTLGLGFSASL